jgi:hypothetical protein
MMGYALWSQDKTGLALCKASLVDEERMKWVLPLHPAYIV